MPDDDNAPVGGPDSLFARYKGAPGYSALERDSARLAFRMRRGPSLPRLAAPRFVAPPEPPPRVADEAPPAKPKNLVDPKIELEYKVVLLDRNLAQYQVGEAATDLLRPDPTRIEVSLRSSAKTPPYQGGGSLRASKCEVFLDAACTQPLNRKLTNAELTARPPTSLYLRGTARGTFDLTLTLDPSNDPLIVVGGPASELMGVVETKLEVFQHDTPVNVLATTYALTGYCTDLEKPDLIPEQVVMSDDHKVSRGRLLHQQSDGHHGRAKAVLSLTASEWPPGTDNYQVVLEATPADLRAYDAETKGARQSLPLKTKVGALLRADKTLWIEGSKASDRLRGVRLSLGLDRAAGGLAKTPKSHGDWARFTVVKIDKVALEHTPPPAGQPNPWNPSKRRWYINYQQGDAGRTVKIRAKLTKPIAGIKLHFMLSPDKENLKEKNWGIDLPTGANPWNWDAITADVKQKDKVNATDLLHKSVDTDAQGQADCDLVLSRFGGDKFLPGVYIAQDPHLAAYVHGHTTLEKRKPKLADNRIKVWRKFAYQKVKVAGRKYPSTDKAEAVYGRVRAEMLKRPSIHLTQAQVQGMALPALLPEYMFKRKGSTKLKLNVSDANQTDFFAFVAAEGEHPIKVPIVTSDYNWGELHDSAIVAGLDDLIPSDFPMNVVVDDMIVCDPPMQGGTLLVDGDWTTEEQDPAANGGAGGWVQTGTGKLAPADVDVDPKRDGDPGDGSVAMGNWAIQKVRIRWPAAAPTSANTRITIDNLTVRGAESNFLGGYNCDTARSKAIVCLFDPANAWDYQNTVVHELGHAFFQTGNTTATAAASPANPPAPGIPLNPTYLWTDTGPHCQHATNKCVMFTSGPIAGSLNRYCPDCHPHLLVQNMTSLS